MTTMGPGEGERPRRMPREPISAVQPPKDSPKRYSRPTVDDNILDQWRAFLIERGYTPEGVLRRAGKERMKELIVEFLLGEKK